MPASCAPASALSPTCRGPPNGWWRFIDHRGTVGAVPRKATPSSGLGCPCSKFRNNEVRLQFHALAYNLGNFMRTLALPKEVVTLVADTLRDLVKIGANSCPPWPLCHVPHLADGQAVSKILFQKILALIDDLRRKPFRRRPRKSDGKVEKTGEVCLDGGNLCQMAFRCGQHAKVGSSEGFEGNRVPAVPSRRYDAMDLRLAGKCRVTCLDVDRIPTPSRLKPIKFPFKSPNGRRIIPTAVDPPARVATITAETSGVTRRRAFQAFGCDSDTLPLTNPV